MEIIAILSWPIKTSSDPKRLLFFKNRKVLKKKTKKSSATRVNTKLEINKHSVEKQCFCYKFMIVTFNSG